LLHQVGTSRHFYVQTKFGLHFKTLLVLIF